MLGKLWAGAILLSIALVGLQLAQGNVLAVQALVQEAFFAQAANAITISIALAGTLAFWMGMFALAESSGMAARIGQWIEPVLHRLMPSVPRGHEAYGAMGLNVAANMLGLDNAATPAGLKAMQQLQTLNTTPDRLSDAQCMFLVLNAGSITLLPISVLLYRAQAGSTDAAIVLLPLLLVSIGASMIGLLACALCQRLPIWRDTTLIAIFGGLIALMVGLAFWVQHSDSTTVGIISSTLGNGLLLAAIAAILISAWRMQVDLLPRFVEGAKDGLNLTLRILPYLLAMLVAVGALRASGGLEGLLSGLRWLVLGAGWDTAFLDALPTGLMKTFSGSAARALMLDTFQTHGVDSFVGRVASLFQGASETTFYVLSIYAGSVGITRVRHALGCSLLSDLASLILAVVMGYMFFAV
jgi:spore maturation protein SpmA/spore maturation protein SpmB